VFKKGRAQLIKPFHPLSPKTHTQPLYESKCSHRLGETILVLILALNSSTYQRKREMRTASQKTKALRAKGVCLIPPSPSSFQGREKRGKANTPTLCWLDPGKKKTNNIYMLHQKPLQEHIYSAFLRKEVPSVSRHLPPVGWQSMSAQPPQTTTVVAWEKTVVIW
jgi:hypothetical protein